MRKISLKVVTLALLFTGSVFANGSNGGDPAKNLKKQVSEILEKYHLKSSEKKLEAKVVLTVNKEQEIVVISIYSDNNRFKKYVKNRLNYLEVIPGGLVEGRRYTIPVKILG